MNEEPGSVTDVQRQQTIDAARRLMTQGRRQSEEIADWLTRSREVVEQARRVLRRAGYHV